MRQRFLCLAAGRLLLGRSTVCQDHLHDVGRSLALPLPHISPSSTQAALEPHLHNHLHNRAISLLSATETNCTSKSRKLRPYPRRSSYSTFKRAIFFLDLLYCGHNTRLPIWVRPKVVVCSPAERLALRESRTTKDHC